MWAALRSDLSEFVHNVAEEGTNALSAIDENIGVRNRDNATTTPTTTTTTAAAAVPESPSNNPTKENTDSASRDNTRNPASSQTFLSPYEEEVKRLREFEETYTYPLISVEFEKQWIRNETTSEPTMNQGDDSDDNGGGGGGGEGGDEESKEVVKESDEQEMEQNGESESESESENKSELDMSEDYDEEELAEVKEFLISFDLTLQQEKINEVLENHESTKSYLEALVPDTITVQQFWARYFFRCDPIRVEQLWKAQEEEEKRIRQARVDAIKGRLSTVKNLFGDVGNVVVGAVSNTVNPINTGGNETRSGLTGSLLGGRPPFVLNTAVSDDEEEEEEELGWDSDDEDYDDESEDGTDDDEDDEEEVVFSSPIKSAGDYEDESNQLRETIQLQADEIKKLHENLNAHTDQSKVELLEMKLFEKDSEIAALKASMNDDDDHQDSSPGSKNIESLDKYEAEITSLKTLLSSANEAMEQMKTNNNDANTEIQALTTQVSQLTALNDQLTEELVQTKEILNQKEIHFSKLLEEEKEKARLQVMENSSLLSSESSCVKVSTVEKSIHNELDEPKVMDDLLKHDADVVDEDEDDWGDSWGDEDDVDA